MFWQFLIAAAFSVGFILWYVADARSGNLDVGTDTAAGQVDAMPNREPTMTGNQTEAKEGESR
jgi:hypothetical protein